MGCRLAFERGVHRQHDLVDAAGGAVARYSVIVFPVDRSLWLPDSRRIRATPPANDGSFSVTNSRTGETKTYPLR